MTNKLLAVLACSLLFSSMETMGQASANAPADTSKVVVKGDNKVPEWTFDFHNVDSSITESVDATNGLPFEKTVNGHVFVNLGLPSGTYWAKCNVGANDFREDGEYYAWGEVTTKNSYTSQNSKWAGKHHIGNLVESDDVATQKWGKEVRMPHISDFDELRKFCRDIQWIEKDGVKGCIFVGRNGRWIFLPAGGHKHDAAIFDHHDWGSYWSSSPNNDNTGKAFTFCFQKGMLYGHTSDVCERGYLIRPVTK